MKFLCAVGLLCLGVNSLHLQSNPRLETGSELRAQFEREREARDNLRQAFRDAVEDREERDSRREDFRDEAESRIDRREDARDQLQDAVSQREEERRSELRNRLEERERERREEARSELEDRRDDRREEARSEYESRNDRREEARSELDDRREEARSEYQSRNDRREEFDDRRQDRSEIRRTTTDRVGQPEQIDLDRLNKDQKQVDHYLRDEFNFLDQDDYELDRARQQVVNGMNYHYTYINRDEDLVTFDVWKRPGEEDEIVNMTVERKTDNGNSKAVILRGGNEQDNFISYLSREVSEHNR